MPQHTELEVSEYEKPSKRGRRITAIYNIAAIIMSITGIIANANKYLIIVLLAYPLFGVALVIFGEGKISLIFNPKNRLYGSINIGFLFTSIFTLVESLHDYTLFTTTSVWFPFILISLLIYFALYTAGVNPFKGKIKVDTVGLLVVGLLYAYGCTRQINCSFDSSSPQTYKAKILGLRRTHGRYTSYYVTLTPWGTVQPSKEVEVDGLLYDDVALGDTVKVNFQRGLLHIPWFKVTKN